MEGDDYALVSNIEDAQTICQIIEREVIDENTLLRLSRNKGGLEILDEGNADA